MNGVPWDELKRMERRGQLGVKIVGKRDDHTMVKQLLGLAPLVWTELPFLSCSHHTYHSIPVAEGTRVSWHLELINGAQQTHQASGPNLAKASTPSTTKYLAFLTSCCAFNDEEMVEVVRACET